ncbi:MAG: AEC family transporter [Deltaproteobacteria bacterium]|nr:AEC family transporter [Deltaproteobacteria bacterium]
MLHVIQTIIPVFAIILLGWFLRSRDFIPVQVLGPLNELVYYLAIPAMIFRAVAHADFQTQFHTLFVVGTLLAVLLVFGAALGAGRLFGVPGAQYGTFLQSSIHGNIGYIGLAVSFYLLGAEGFTRASILAGFLMVF